MTLVGLLVGCAFCCISYASRCVSLLSSYVAWFSYEVGAGKCPQRFTLEGFCFLRKWHVFTSGL